MRKYINAFTIKRYTSIFIIIAVVAVFSLIVNMTIAYLGDSDSKKNTVNVGYGDVSIDEKFDEPSELKMTNDIKKEIQIQNKSTVPAFVRVYAEFSDSELAEQAKVKYGEKTYSWSDFKTKLNYQNPSPDENDSALVSSKWRYVPSNDSNGLGGYFYYTEALSAYKPANTEITPQQAEVPGGKTDKLFDSVTIDYRKYTHDDVNNTDVPDNDDSNIDRIQPLEMIVYSELVQTVETGTTTVGTGENAETTYGYDYATNNEWEKAWKSFLKVNNTTP